VANRIAKGHFWLNGKAYQLAVNNGPNHLHGGLKGFDKQVWKAMPTEDGGVAFSLHDPAGSNGYPGDLDVTVIYRLTDDNEMRIQYMATADAATPINLTNHAYFNLGTPVSGSIEDHILQIFADHYTPVDDTLIPTGRVAAVQGTPYDFRKPHAIGYDMPEEGYDHNWVLNGPEGDFKHVAHVEDPQTGRVMDIYSDQPGVQFYTGNFLDGTLTGKGGVKYQKRGAFCLETQHFPDSINHANFPSVVLKPGEVFRSVTVHRFSVD
jgi:aldose 1-epimerase